MKDWDWKCNILNKFLLNLKKMILKCNLEKFKYIFQLLILLLTI